MFYGGIWENQSFALDSSWHPLVAPTLTCTIRELTTSKFNTYIGFGPTIPPGPSAFKGQMRATKSNQHILITPCLFACFSQSDLIVSANLVQINVSLTRSKSNIYNSNGNFRLE